MLRDSPVAQFWSMADTQAIERLNDDIIELENLLVLIRFRASPYTLDYAPGPTGRGARAAFRDINTTVSRLQASIVLRYRYFQLRSIGCTEMMACQWPLNSSLTVGGFAYPDVRLLWSDDASCFYRARINRFREAFRPTLRLTLQCRWYLRARAQLVRSDPHLSGQRYWRRVWDIPEYMWRQLEWEYTQINGVEPLGKERDPRASPVSVVMGVWGRRGLREQRAGRISAFLCSPQARLLPWSSSLMLYVHEYPRCDLPKEPG